MDTVIPPLVAIPPPPPPPPPPTFNVPVALLLPPPPPPLPLLLLCSVEKVEERPGMVVKVAFKGGAEVVTSPAHTVAGGKGLERSPRMAMRLAFFSWEAVFKSLTTEVERCKVMSVSHATTPSPAPPTPMSAKGAWECTTPLASGSQKVVWLWVLKGASM